jgi:hypothetical protein
MSDLLNVIGSSIPVGTIINAVGPPDSTWKKCDGSILNQVDYPAYVNVADDLHPRMWADWTIKDANQGGTMYSKYDASCMGTTAVIVGVNTQIYRSTDSGQSWSVITPSIGTGSHYAVENDGTRFVVTLYNTANCYYSTDGNTWNSATLPATKYWRWMVYASGMFCMFNATTEASPIYATSSNGSTWTQRSAPWANVDLETVATDGTNILAYAYDHYDHYRLYYSTDGINWSSGTDNFLYGMWDSWSNYINQLFYFDGTWYMVHEGGTDWYLKYEGTNILNPDHWNMYDFSVSNNLPSWGNYFVMAKTSDHIVIPNDGENGLLIGKSMNNLTSYGTQFIKVDAIANDSGDNYMIAYHDRGETVAVSTGVGYDDSTKFQIPNLLIDSICPGVYPYIKLLE